MAFVPPPPPRRSFFRGDVVNKMPYAADMLQPTAIEDHILKGFMPEEKFIGPHSNIVAFGSCFAANIGRYLNGLGFDIATQREGKAYIQRISDGLVNVFAIAQQFEWAWENRVPEVHLWHGWKAEDYGYDEEVRLETKRLFDEADVFILTFGLSEIWYDEPTGEVFWRAVPEDKFDPSRHKFRVATHAETVERLNRIYTLIRKHRPEAAIIFTLSPVGLAATFRSISCIAANAVSKAKLRSAIDEVHTGANDKNFFYFPSYEVVIEAFESPFNIDRRHPQIHAVETNMKAFEAYFCQTSFTKEGLREYIAGALSTDQIATRGDKAAAAEIQKSNRARWVAENPGATSVDKVIKRRNTSRTKETAKAALMAEKEAVKAAKAQERAQTLADKVSRRDQQLAEARAAQEAKKAEAKAVAAQARAELLAQKATLREQEKAKKTQKPADEPNERADRQAARALLIEAKAREAVERKQQREAMRAAKAADPQTDPEALQRKARLEQEKEAKRQLRAANAQLREERRQANLDRSAEIAAPDTEAAE